MLWGNHLWTSACQYFVLNSYHERQKGVVFLRRAVAVILSLLASFMDIKIAVIPAGLPLPLQQMSGSAVHWEFQDNCGFWSVSLRGWPFRMEPLFEGCFYGLVELYAPSSVLAYFSRAGAK